MFLTVISISLQLHLCQCRSLKKNMQGNTDEILLIPYNLHESRLIRIRESRSCMVSSPINVVTEGSVPSDICTAKHFFVYVLSCQRPSKLWRKGCLFLYYPFFGFIYHQVLQCSQKWKNRYQISIYLGPQLHLQLMEDLSLVFSHIVSSQLLHNLHKPNCPQPPAHPLASCGGWWLNWELTLRLRLPFSCCCS